MKLIRRLEDIDSSVQHGAVSIGNFDGVHRGHAEIMRRLREHAENLAGPAIAFTFDPHPVRLLRPAQVPPPLTWTNRKAQLLGELGIDALIAYPTDLTLLNLSARDFFRDIVVNSLAAQAVIEGPNFFFGKHRSGDTAMLKQLCESHNMTLEIVPPLVAKGDLVSSSRVRELLGAGHVEDARGLLTRPYRLRGMITHGARRGAQIGFPTANLEAIDTLVPKMGVYAGQAILRGQSHAAAINIGPNPTFGEDVSKVEVHLIDFGENIYGETLEVDFLARLRDIQTFSSAAELAAQLKSDVIQARKFACC